VARLAPLVLLVVMATVTGAPAQAPAPPAIQGPVHVVTYVEVQPPSVADALTLLARHREATRRQDGLLRCEVAQRIGQPNQLVVLEAWRDQAALEAHGRAPATGETREKLAAMRLAPIDQRVHGALTVDAAAPTIFRDAAYVVTHVDVIPPRKDDAIVALRRLADASRTEPGHQRFDVVQQATRPNHFTVIEVWTDARAAEAHAMAAAAREFRDTLAPMTGALYDERFYRRIE
jgi:quinol monooxygenase YgiN